MHKCWHFEAGCLVIVIVIGVLLAAPRPPRDRYRHRCPAGRLHDHLVIDAVIGVLLAGSTTTS
jgi:hypothetical protein